MRYEDFIKNVNRKTADIKVGPIHSDRSPLTEKWYDKINSNPEMLSKAKEIIEEFNNDMEEVSYIAKYLNEEFEHGEGSFFWWEEIAKLLIEDVWKESESSGKSHPGTQILPPDDYDIIDKMSQWYWSQGDPIYAVVSSWFSGKSVSKSLLESAIYNLESDFNKTEEGSDDYQELSEILDSLNYILSELGGQR